MNEQLKKYDKFILVFSGGKDCTAVFLWLLEQGVDKGKIELWHHLVDGLGGRNFMDWPVTESYCQAFADHFEVPIYFSWKEGGFRREMNRKNEATAPIFFEIPHPYKKGEKCIKETGGNGPVSTRMKFPQVSADLKTRWCSAYLKIDVCAAAIRNQKRFEGLKTMVLSGERGEESSARAKYNIQEPDRSDNRGGKRVDRHVDRLRPIRDWREGEVWEIIAKHCVVVHPCYYLGWSRCSCLFCIFGNKDQFASANFIAPQMGNSIIQHEEEFGVTIKRKQSLVQVIMAGKPYEAITPQLVSLAMNKDYRGQITNNDWFLPAGAFGEGCGPN